MIKNWKINKKCNLVECNVVCQEIVLAPIFLLFLDSISALFSGSFTIIIKQTCTFRSQNIMKSLVSN